MDWMPLALFMAGLGLVVLEVFIPSMGALSVLAGLCLLGASVMGWDSSMPWLYPALTVVGIPLTLTVSYRILPKTRFGKRLIVDGTTFEADEGVGVDKSVLDLAGKTGTARSTCRPAGLAEIDGRRVDVVTRGEMLSTGTPVTVIAVEGNRVVVRETETEGNN